MQIKRLYYTRGKRSSSGLLATADGVIRIFRRLFSVFGRLDHSRGEVEWESRQKKDHKIPPQLLASEVALEFIGPSVCGLNGDLLRSIESHNDFCKASLEEFDNLGGSPVPVECLPTRPDIVLEASLRYTHGVPHHISKEVQSGPKQATAVFRLFCCSSHEITVIKVLNLWGFLAIRAFLPACSKKREFYRTMKRVSGRPGVNIYFPCNIIEMATWNHNMEQ